MRSDPAPAFKVFLSHPIADGTAQAAIYAALAS
jgi:hypothetical protein